MKYLLLAVVASVLFVLVYSRVRPYLQAIHKVITFLNTATPSSNINPRAKSSSPALEHKLVRCGSCGTWIPADRALSLNSGLATFCSRECLEKRAAPKEKKMAG